MAKKANRSVNQSDIESEMLELDETKEYNDSDIVTILVNSPYRTNVTETTSYARAKGLIAKKFAVIV